MDDGDEPPRRGAAGPGTAGGAGAGPDAGGAAAPGDDADFRALAEDWIAIWQSEVTTYLTDPETQQAWAAMLAVWAGAAQAMMRAMPRAPGFGHPYAAPAYAAPESGRPRRAKPAPPGRDHRDGPATDEPAGADAAPGAAPAAAASVARDDEVRRLERRVADLERHLAERDQADQDRRRGAAGADRRPRRTGRPRG